MNENIDAMAEVMACHYIDITVTTPDAAGLCVCGTWASGAMAASWDEHLAEALDLAGFRRMQLE